MRFTKVDGDLPTASGRRKLWKLIDRLQPENIWVAPECRPWVGWARLNQFKSVKLFDQISKDQHEQLQHVNFVPVLRISSEATGAIFILNSPWDLACQIFRSFKAFVITPKWFMLICVLSV